MRRQRTYWCQREGDGLLIRNDAGEQIRWRNHEEIEANLEDSPDRAIKASHPYLQALFRDAAVALGLSA
jgi:single-stranded-DNA-specific exonuclease